MASENLKNKVAENISLIGDDYTYIFCDTESTGFQPNDIYGKLLEIAAIKVCNNKVIGEFQRLINPEIKISKKISEVTGITNEMVKGANTYSEVLKEFDDFVKEDKKTVFVFHNANHDIKFLNFFACKIGISFANNVIDTLTMSKYFLPNEKSYKLEELCKKYGIEDNQHHRALNDAKATYELFKLLLKKVTPLDKAERNKRTEKQNSLQRFDCDVVKCNYWEKEVKKNLHFHRIYLTISRKNDYANIYYDFDKKEWGEKDSSFDELINYEIVQKKLLQKYNIENINNIERWKKIC